MAKPMIAVDRRIHAPCRLFVVARLCLRGRRHHPRGEQQGDDGHHYRELGEREAVRAAPQLHMAVVPPPAW